VTETFLYLNKIFSIISPYYIIISRKNQALLSFFKVRVVINNKEIYELASNKPIIIEVKENNPKIVITDGFHFTRPVKLTYKEPSFYKFNVVCIIDDMQLFGGVLMLFLSYLIGFYTGNFVLKVLSFIPVILFLFAFYFNRRTFIKIVQHD